MATLAEPPPIGHNNPPAPTPYEAHKANVDDLEVEAKNFLDGGPIATEEQAEAVAKLLSDARDARNAAEAQRKIEAKPFDDGKAAVQALWTPITDEKKGRCALIADTCKKVLAPWLQKLEDEQRAAAETAKREAEELAEAAAQTRHDANPDSLSDQTAVRERDRAAAEAHQRATRLEKAKPQARGGERAVGLRTRYRAEITDPLLFGKWAWEHRREDYTKFLGELAERECRHGPKGIPGITVHEDKRAA